MLQLYKTIQLLEKNKKRGDLWDPLGSRHFILILPINGAAAVRDQGILP
jgi:hypothetical protein